MTLTEFLLARIAEDEYDALPFRNRLGDVKRWRCDEVGGKVREVGTPEFGLSDVIAESDTHMTAAHIARHDPARVLADCEAKRRIVALHKLVPAGLLASGEVGCETCDIEIYWSVGDIGYSATGGCETLRLLARPYADHPGYRDEWRP